MFAARGSFGARLPGLEARPRRGAQVAGHRLAPQGRRGPIRLLAALLAGACAGACETGAPPRLEVTGGVTGAPLSGTSAPGEGASPRVALRAGELATARYEIRNSGGRALVLHGLTLDCGCRLASALPDALSPGESAAITALCRAPLAAGDAIRELRLLSSDPAQPETRLRLAMSVAGAGAEPPALYFGYVPVGGAAVRELTLPASGRDRPGGNGRRVESGAAGGASAGPSSPAPVAVDPAISVEPRPLRADGARLYRVRFAPRSAGPLRTVLDLGPDAGTVPVSGVGFRRVLAFPAEVMLPSVLTAGGPPAVALKSVSDVPLEITRIELPPGLAGELHVVRPGHEFRLSLRARVPDGVAAGAIRLHTSAFDEPLITIPVLRADAS